MGERILVVDDEPTVLMFCTRALSRMGYEAQGVSSGEEALALLKTGAFDVLVTDIAMPGMNGIELLRQAREILPELVVVVITGVGSIDLAIKALRGGAQDFLPKPFTPLELKSAVDRALAQVRMAQERTQMRVLMPLFELAKQRLEHVDLYEFYDQVLTLALKETRADSAALFSLGDDDQTFTKEASIGKELSCGPECATLIRVARERQGAFVVDDQVAKELGIHEAFERAGVEAVLCAPLHAPGRYVGILLLTKAQGQGAFRPADIEILTILSGQVAGLVENARLVAQLEEWNRELERRVEERTRALEEAQQRLLRSERLATVGQLGASIAHELRNPLGVINNSVYFLRLRLGEEDPKITKHLDIIEHEVRSANKIITDLMNFVRVKEVEKEVLDPNVLVERVLNKIEVPENIAIKTQLDPSLPAAPFDAVKMEQILVNLLNNAIQAMPQGGEVVISTSKREGWICFSIRDTGEGIRPEDLPRIFEPLFTTRAKGIGLGLSIVKLLVDAHHGEIEVSSQVGQGTEFIVKIPYEEKDLSRSVTVHAQGDAPSGDVAGSG
ncbi:MAG: response regulator [Chloroflexi bacterium]|nr:response regulator [Chloroflexota bacterium]